MKLIIKIMLVAIPPIFTGIITFWITKYKYHKDRPLSRYEIAYNRVYYPLFSYLIKMELKKVKREDYIKIIDYATPRIIKYEKYIDRSTYKTFLNFQKILEKNGNIRPAYNLFEKNIIYFNSKIRIHLGYLETGSLLRYKYLSFWDKCRLNLIILGGVGYSSIACKIILSGSGIPYENIILRVNSYIFSACLIFIIVFSVLIIANTFLNLFSSLVDKIKKQGG